MKKKGTEQKGRRKAIGKGCKGGAGFLALLLVLLACLWLYEKDGTFFSGRETQENTEMDIREDGLEIHFIDVGQGDATLIKCGEHAMLIDAGDYTRGSAVWLYLQKQNVDRLDYVIGTHLDADHIGGMDVLITKFDCGVILIPEYEKDTRSSEELFDSIKAKNYRNTQPVAGDTYQLGDAVFIVLAPEKEFYETENDYSIGIRLTYGQNSFLFVGDAQKESEDEMLASGRELKADVLKVGHHGSSSSTSEEFLHTAAPTYAVISCGEGNDYGHPHAAVLNLLRRKGVRVFRTDEQGSIVAYSDGTNIAWNCAPSESWKAGEMVSN